MRHVYLALIALALVTVCASDVLAASASLKRISRAVALIAIEVSKADTDDESVALAEAARIRLAAYLAGLPGFQPDVQAAPGYCAIVVASGDYQIWSEASGGRLIGSGVGYSK
jgi:hypothetical protein